MEQKEIIEGNKLIAIFMGTEIKGTKGPYKYRIGDQAYQEEGLRYHSNWNWLMDVMEKIGKDYNARITWTAGAMEVTYIDRPDIHDDNSIADFGGFGSIMNTWKCAVKFIQWYNIKFKVKS